MRALLILVAATSLPACQTGAIAGEGDLDDTSPAPDMRMDDPGEELPVGDESAARMLFEEQVLPLLQAKCYGCHEPGGDAGYEFLNTPDDYQAAVELPRFIDVYRPLESRVVAKGEHEGQPWWNAGEAAQILVWIEAEVANRAGDVGPTSQVPAQGFNEHDLGPAGAPGARLHYYARTAGTQLLLYQVTLAAGAQGIVVEYPTIEVFVDGAATTALPLYDPEFVDDPDETQIVLGPDTFENFGDYTIADFPASAQLGVRFGEIRAALGNEDDPGACRELDAFRTYAKRELSFYCQTCHTGGAEPEAPANMDLTTLGAISEPGQQRACQAVLAHIDREDPFNSILFRNPDPDFDNGHPFTFTDAAELAAFRTSILQWASRELSQ